MADEVSIPVPDTGAQAPVADAVAPAVNADVAEVKIESQPTLLEAAAGKPETKTEEVKVEVSPEPAPAEADKGEVKEAKADGEKPEAKAEEPKPDADKATDPVKEATAELQPPAPVKYEAFKVPDGIKLDDKELGKFTEVLGSAQVKQEDVQKLVDLYTAERQRDFETARTEQREHWNKLNDTWKTDTRKDEKLGGNRLETSLSMAKAFIEEYGGSKEQVRELMAHLNNNGMGNFIGFIRLAHNAATALNIFEDSVVSANPSTPKEERGPGKRGWYGNMGNGQAT
jgi:hypothetical protein